MEPAGHKERWVGMSGDDMQVDPAMMAKGKSYVETASSDVRSFLNSLENDVNELLPGWQSSGSKGFKQAHDSWTQKAVTINNALDDLGQKLGVVGAQTHNVDENVTNGFNSFRS